MLGRGQRMFNRGQGEWRRNGGNRRPVGPVQGAMSGPGSKDTLMTRLRSAFRSLRTAMTRPVPGVDGCGPTRVRDYPVSRPRSGA
jgi:hypothetical protein